MAITTAGEFQIIADALGNADNGLQAQMVDTSGTSIYELALARQTVYAQTLEADFDNGNTLSQAIRSVEKTIPSKIDILLYSIPPAIDAYFIAQTGSKMRDYFVTGITWSVYFRSLWRRAMKEEILVQLAHVSRGSSTWNSLVTDTTIVLDQTLKVVTGSSQAIGANDITLTLTMLKADTTTATESLRIPASTAASTSFTIGTNVKYQAVSAVSLAGGTNGDTLDFWVKGAV